MNRSLSHPSEIDEPPSIHRRSRSPSDAPHDVDSLSTTDISKDQHLESRVAALELSKSNEKEAEKLKENHRETAQRAEFAKPLNTHSGGMYIPPARLRAMQAAASADKTSAEYQRLSSILGCLAQVHHGYRQSGEHYQYQANRTGAVF